MANKKEVSKKGTKKNVISKAEQKKEEKVVKEVKKEEKKNTNKKEYDKLFKFYDFIDKYRLAIYGVIGGVLATVLVVILIWPDRIAKLENGLEPVASIDGLTVTAEDLYEDMKEIYSVNNLLDIIDNKILEEKYPETDEMNTELNDQAENYYNMYNQYYGYSKEEFLTKSGFGSERAFIEYLRLQYRRTQYTDDYIKEQITDKEIEKYYEDKVYGDINTKHILVKVSSSATDEEKKEAENLAKEIITDLHGEEEFNKALNISECLFSDRIWELSANEIIDSIKDIPKFNVKNGELLIDVLVNNNVVSSKREAREMINAGAISINGKKEIDLEKNITKNDAIEDKVLLIKKGKKNYFLGLM